ncbi:MAG: GyrI-like domain-containing protein [Anaerolineae bacterium]|nr:GyrI-like domain-containing protein [Anaerolineae bacterium]
MHEIEVRIVKLEPMRVARFHGYGTGPEDIAWQKLETWAKTKGLLDFSEAHRIFGFNNPDPAPGSPKYGYDFWITATPEETSGEDVEIIEFPGGLYAVTLCPIKDGDFENIGRVWKQLVTWREDSPYKCGHHQWLEKHVHIGEPGHDFDLDLYLPISE